MRDRSSSPFPHPSSLATDWSPEASPTSFLPMKPLDITSRLRTSGSMYDERMVAPMRDDLTEAGFRELRTPDEVDAALKDSTGTVLVMVNSVCGCAAGRARPGVKLALR